MFVRAGLFGFIAAIGLVATSHAEAPAPALVIPLKSYLGAIPSMEVQLGGKPSTVLLDTAGGLTVFMPSGVAKAGCEPWGRVTGTRMRGDRLELPRCDNVVAQVEGRALSIPEAGVWDFSKMLPKDAPPLDGSVALDAFAGKLITLDLSGNRLIVETPASAHARTAHAVEVPMRLAREVGGASLTPMMAIQTPKGKLWFELDCGSDADIMVNRAVADVLGLDPSSKKDQPLGVALAPGLPVKGSAQVLDLVVDGNIGAPVLRQWVITMDLAHERLWVSPVASAKSR
jgi:hypothetical protein